MKIGCLNIGCCITRVGLLISAADIIMFELLCTGLLDKAVVWIFEHGSKGQPARLSNMQKDSRSVGGHWYFRYADVH